MPHDSTNPNWLGCPGDRGVVRHAVECVQHGGGFDRPLRQHSSGVRVVGVGVGQSEISVNLAKTIGSVNLIVGDDNITSFKGKIGIFDIENNKINHRLNFYEISDGELKEIF